MLPMNSRFGIFAWFGYRIHLAERVKLIADAGFSATSLWWGEEETANTGSLHDLPPIIRDHGLDIDNVHLPFYQANSLFDQDTASRQKAVDYHIACLEDCAKHKIPIMVMHACYPDRHPKPSSLLIKSVTQIAERAEKLGITIAVENAQCSCCFDLVFSQINSPSLGFCYDSSHDWIFSDEKTTPLKNCHSYLATTHLSDNDGIEDRHWFPGNGIIDWNRIARAFPKQSYKGRIMLEILPKDGTPEMPPKEFIQKAAESTDVLKILLPDQIRQS